MPRLLIIRGTVAKARQVKPGEVIEVSDQDAQTLLALKRAIPAPDDEPEAAVKPAGETTTPRRRTKRRGKTVDSE